MALEEVALVMSLARVPERRGEVVGDSAYFQHAHELWDSEVHPRDVLQRRVRVAEIELLSERQVLHGHAVVVDVGMLELGADVIDHVDPVDTPCAELDEPAAVLAAVAA